MGKAMKRKGKEEEAHEKVKRQAHSFRLTTKNTRKLSRTHAHQKEDAPRKSIAPDNNAEEEASLLNGKRPRIDDYIL